MKVLKRATKAIVMYKGKSLVLFLLVSILGGVVLGSVSTWQAINRTDEGLRLRMRPIVTFDHDERAHFEYIEMGGEWRHSFITPDIVRAVGKLPYVHTFNYSVIGDVSTWDLRQYRYGQTDQDLRELERRSIFRLYGTSLIEPLEVVEELIILVDGRLFEHSELNVLAETNPAIISTQLAHINNLMIGDRFKVEVVIEQPRGWESDSDRIGDDPIENNHTENLFAHAFYELEIVGLFEIPSNLEEEISTDDQIWLERERISELANRIFVPNLISEAAQGFLYNSLISLESIQGEYFITEMLNEVGEWEYMVETLLLLKDPLELSYFILEAEELLPDFWVISTLESDFENIAIAMENVRNIADWILLASASATFLIVSLVILLFLRDRRTEIGIYLALGERKLKIIFQLLSEVIIVSTFGLICAVIIGHILTAFVSQEMLHNELTYIMMSTENETNIFMPDANSLVRMGFSQNLTVDEMLDLYDISLESQTIILLFTTSMLVIILISTVPILLTMRLKPKEILTFTQGS